jgi:hypothetical protein
MLVKAVRQDSSAEFPFVLASTYSNSTNLLAGNYRDGAWAPFHKGAWEIKNISPKMV